ncbi:hypothetical protein F4781DRAFT_407510 [Annulohypoxylon bovei var. microspora]|nr:hypothetical protein F4781DRAFT_407510 [Annulohypoxylon bovei var. microspora]
MKSSSNLNDLTRMDIKIPPIPEELEVEHYIDSKMNRDMYSEQRARLTSESAAREKVDDFCKAMKIFSESNIGKESKLDRTFDIRGFHDWDEVLATARLAERHYEENALGTSGILRNICRRIGDYQDALKPWIQLIPSETNYLSILCGGLKLLIGAACYRAQERDSILDIFSSLQSLRDEVKCWSRLFQDDPIVSHHTLRAYIALLVMIEAQLLSLVGEKTWKTIWKSVKKVKAGKREAEKAHEDFKSTVEKIKARINQLHIENSTETGAQLKKHMEDIRQIIEDKGQDNLTYLDSMKAMFMVTSAMFKWNLAHQSDSQLAVAHKNDQIRRNLLDFLAVSNHNVDSDKDSIKNMAQSLPYPPVTEFCQLLDSPYLQQTLRFDASEMLHICTDSMEFAGKRISPTSLISTAMIESRLGYKNVYVAYFFCGAHLDLDDPLRGTTGLVRSLIRQLLDFDSHIDLDNVISRDMEVGLRHHEFVHLCELFCQLAMHISVSRLLFVVDQVQLCQVGRGEEQLEYFVRAIHSLFESFRLDGKIKFIWVGSGSRPVGDETQLRRILLPGEGGEQ